MAYQKLRIVSNQSDPLTEEQNLLDFRIPSNLHVEADKSYISLFCKIETTDDNPAAVDGTGSAASQQFSGGSGVYNLGVAVDIGGGVVEAVKSVGLVKNAHMISANKGNVEHLRDVNKLRLSLQTLENSYQRDNDQAHTELGRLNNKAWGTISPFIMTGAAGYGQAATYLNKELRIPLKDIFNICDNNNLDTGYLGACDIHLELDLGRIAVVDEYNEEEQVFTGANGYGLCEDDVKAGDKTSVTLSKSYDFTDHEEECPFYLGQKIKFTAGNIQIAAPPAGPQDLTDYERRITGISHVDNKVILGLDQTLGNSQAAGLTGAIVVPLEAPNETEVTINRAEMVLRVNDSAPAQNGYEYTTYTVEKDQGGGIESFNKQYECEPESINLLVHLPINNGVLISNLRPDSTRVSINNKETTNRNVGRHTPLYNSQLNKYALNSALVVKNLGQGKKKVDYNSATPSTHENPNTESFIYEPLPQTPNLKLVNIEVECRGGHGMSDINLFKEVVRTI